MRGLTKIAAVCITLWSAGSFVSGGPSAPSRLRDCFDEGWAFALGDIAGAERPDFKDGGWRVLNLPHDWSIEGAFSPDNPAGHDGGALPGGVGWYRKVFSLEESLRGKNVFIEFDGVYMNSEVWLNGHYLGRRPYGYISFQYEMTPHLRFGPEKNVLAVRVDNSKQPNSRWYSGSGIYRHVWLTAVDPVHVAHWGTYVIAPEVTAERARLIIHSRIENSSGSAQTATLRSTILDPAGRKVGEALNDSGLPAAGGHVFHQNVSVAGPALWDLERPNLYRLITDVLVDGKLRDRTETPFGIREFRFDKDKGFFLNGRPVKIKGVCNHHDQGCLGAAVSERALEHQLELLKAMGCNGIRTSHNPPAPELLDLCDRMGFLVMDEAFDCWRLGKTTYDYSLYFTEWHERDLRDMVLRDRNHPSVILWSIGNEIREQGTPDGGELARSLAAIVRSLDATRPVTSGMNGIEKANENGFARALDVAGVNYAVKIYDRQKEIYPDVLFVASETTSAVASRGIYHMPSDKMRLASDDLQCSSYDNCWVPWGDSAIAGWSAVRDRDWMSGLFIWTGFDYLGEPTPYKYPARSSYFGILDLCGFPKDSYYYYQSQWAAQPVLHIFPHWNWKEGELVDVWAYTNLPEVELFLNGRSLGLKRLKAEGGERIVWRVKFEPGELRAVGAKDGNEVLVRKVLTSGTAARVELEADRTALRADGRDLAFITVRIKDKDGNLVPYADNLVQFDIEGPGFIAGVDNGCPTSLEPFKADSRKAFSGMCLAVFQATRTPGRVTVRARSEGLREASVSLQTAK